MPLVMMKVADSFTIALETNDRKRKPVRKKTGRVIYLRLAGQNARVSSTVIAAA
jgi:hypothetical protein